MFRDVGQARKTCEPRCTSYIIYDLANINQVYIHAPITVKLQARNKTIYKHIPISDNLKIYNVLNIIIIATNLFIKLSLA